MERAGVPRVGMEAKAGGARACGTWAKAGPRACGALMDGLPAARKAGMAAKDGHCNADAPLSMRVGSLDGHGRPQDSAAAKARIRKVLARESSSAGCCVLVFGSRAKSRTAV